MMPNNINGGFILIYFYEKVLSFCFVFIPFLPVICAKRKLQDDPKGRLADAIFAKRCNAGSNHFAGPVYA